MTLAQHKRSLPVEERKALWVPTDLKKEIHKIAIDEDRQLFDVTEEIVRVGLATRQTPVPAVPRVVTDPKAEYTLNTNES